MSTSPISLHPEPNAPEQKTGVHQAVPATHVPQPTQAVQTAPEAAQPAVQGSRQNQIQQLFLQGESVAQIASQTGLSVSDVDIELDISSVATDVTAKGSESASAATPSSSPAANAIANYGAAAEPARSSPNAGASGTASGSTLSVEA